jgi:alpha-L-fucosidase 2
VVAAGQEIAVNQSGSKLGFLDTSTYGPVQGTGTIVYADGSTQSFTLTVPDWYSGGTAGAAISMTYRNAPGNTQDDHPVGVYEQSVALDSTAEVTGVILPDVSQGLSGPAMHVFALAAGPG